MKNREHIKQLIMCFECRIRHIEKEYREKYEHKCDFGECVEDKEKCPLARARIAKRELQDLLTRIEEDT